MEATVIFYQDYSYTRKDTGVFTPNYRIYFTLADGQGVWLRSERKYNAGEKIQVGIRGTQYGDYKGQAELYII